MLRPRRASPAGRTSLRVRKHAYSLFAGTLPLIAVAAPAQTTPQAAIRTAPDVEHLRDFQAIELRRYTIKPGEREHFAQYFESYFPEAFEQMGAIAFGQFFERNHPTGFTWIRGFHTLSDRPIANAAFYYGPLWKEHRGTLNNLITDSDNVLLLRPLNPDSQIPVLPAVDPVTEASGAQGIVVAQIFPVKANSVDAFAQQAQEAFAAYRAAGAREAGILVTLDVPNNFPQLPIRTDGPYLVWLGIVRNNQALEQQMNPVFERSLAALSATGLLRGAPELVILDPSPRSRLRWLPPSPHNE
jgi:hypothetical protein